MNSQRGKGRMGHPVVQRIIGRIEAIEQSVTEMYRLMLDLQEQVQALQEEMRAREEERGRAGNNGAHEERSGLFNLLSFRRKDA